ncbi:hypothetical protein K435DRAFT_821225 [Dendrothele bispora CBS 962.96]|uniref:Helitron helicase-like domain-containing protein n=1 Tax=Dendrothele bispora (strain CBS 962.96) TaxID=1314807 RepID=A0A4S8LLW2_DENBC|nr:hypothetical protein K435DRAFT_821225 [Dendrothele bispora CBS 962.96]
MFPTLFPLGIGGFEDSERKPPVSFDTQANYFLDLHDRRFRYHYSFLFVVFNIKQRRMQHLQVHFTTSSKRYASVTLKNLASRIDKEKFISSPSDDERKAFHLLKEVNTVAARVPGSQSTKVHIRNEIRSYFGYFGLPHLFFTFNPCAVHSPIFQVIYGDNSFQGLNAHLDWLVILWLGLIFFEFSFKAAFQYLLGWDFKTGKSTECGGIFGKLRAFYGTVELTERGEFHGHVELWILILNAGSVTFFVL